MRVSGAIIRRLEEDKFELVVRRSFSDYLWLLDSRCKL
ncbi:sarcosine oxidase subunit gamma family protein [Vibrio sp. M60_M31a]